MNDAAWSWTVNYSGATRPPTALKCGVAVCAHIHPEWLHEKDHDWCIDDKWLDMTWLWLWGLAFWHMWKPVGAILSRWHAHPAWAFACCLAFSLFFLPMVLTGAFWCQWHHGNLVPYKTWASDQPLVVFSMMCFSTILQWAKCQNKSIWHEIPPNSSSNLHLRLTKTMQQTWETRLSTLGNPQ